MTYSDSAADNAQLLWRTVTGATDFSGRSRRSEVFYYWIASLLVSTVLNYAVETVASLYASIVFETALHFLLTIPIFAPFARRLHDLDRSGWWVLFISLLVALQQILPWLPIFPDRPNLIISAPSALYLLVFLFLCLMPGTRGVNRYGIDPRLNAA
jgi:uncharacterized membrane protein YhaH (DUF805 family)